MAISIHALREEGDRPSLLCWWALYLFLSTPSARRATKSYSGSFPFIEISIHALREEGDASCTAANAAARYFYPRPPRGGRRITSFKVLILIGFLSTPSARRATDVRGRPVLRWYISIHALREEGDPLRLEINTRPPNFYPRPPRGGRRAGRRRRLCVRLISIHALREEGDMLRTHPCYESMQFLSTPSARRATSTTETVISSISNFYPRPPRGGRLSTVCSRTPRPTPFLSTPSARGRRGRLRSKALTKKPMQFLSTPSARRAT